MFLPAFQWMKSCKHFNAISNNTWLFFLIFYHYDSFMSVESTGDLVNFTMIGLIIKTYVSIAVM